MSNLEQTKLMYSRETGNVYAPLESGGWVELGCMCCDITDVLPDDTQPLVVIDT